MFDGVTCCAAWLCSIKFYLKDDDYNMSFVVSLEDPQTLVQQLHSLLIRGDKDDVANDGEGREKRFGLTWEQFSEKVC